MLGHLRLSTNSLVRVLKNFLSRKPFLPRTEPARISTSELAPPLNYFTMDVIATDGDYDDNSFYNDLDKIEKPYEVPKDYEEVQ